MIIAQDDSVYDNYSSLTGAPAVRVTGLRVRFNNHSGASLQSDDSASPAIVFDGADGTLFNETGATIQAALASSTAVAGSSGADSVINDGTIVGNVDLGGGDDSFDGHAGTLSGGVYGFDGDDQLTGGAGSDSLDGGAGDDLIDGGAGGDSMTGGTGNDVFYVDDSGDVVTENPGEGTADEVRTTLSGYVLADNVEKLTWTGAGGGDLRGNGLDNVLTGGAGPDFFHLQDGGNDIVNLGGGNDAAYFGAAYTAGDSVDGGAGSDQVALQGDYSGGVTLGTLAGVETLVAMTHSDTRFGGGSASPYSYNIVSPDSTVAAGTQLMVNASTLEAGENLTFDGSAETNGSFFIYGGKGVDTLTGGSGADVFFFAEDGRFSATDHVDGGAGADAMVLRGNYSLTLSGTSIVNVETVVLNSGSDARFYAAGTPFSYDITTADDTVAAGQTMTFNGGQLSAAETLHFDGSLETNGNFRLFGGSANDVIKGGAGNDLIYGGLGADRLTGGAGIDIYQYKAAAESTGTGYDTITGFRPNQDAIILPGHQIDHFDSQLLSGALSASSFDSDLAAAIGSGILPAFKTVLFRPDSGDLAGSLFLVADSNGAAGYQSGQDYVIRLDQFDGYVATLGDASVAEGDSGTTPLVFTVTLDRPATADVTIAYQTTPGTAAAGTDYVFAAGQLVIAAGQQSGTITVEVNGDTAPESDETLRLDISGAQLATALAATGTILDDEPTAVIVDGDRRTGDPGFDVLSLDGDVALTRNSLFSGYEEILLGTRRDEDQIDGHTYSFTIDDDNAPNFGPRLIVDGSALAADTDGAGPLIAETLYLDVSAATTYFVEVHSGAGDDVIKGTSRSDSIWTGAGNDLVYYTGGYDTVDMGTGTADTLDMTGRTFKINTSDQSSIQIPVGGQVDAHGVDIIQGGQLQVIPTSATIDMSAVFPSYTYQFVNTSLYLPANSSSTTISFGTSIPTFFSQLELNGAFENYDTLDFSALGGPVVLTVDNSQSVTSIWISSGNTTFANYTGVPNIIGSAYGDTLVGTVWNCIISGGGGDDSITGSTKADQIHGGDGNDILTGGGAPDGFYFDTALSASTNVDTITDFAHGQDLINLDNAVFTALADGALPASAFALGTAATDPNQHILYDGSTGWLYYDPDGNGAAAAVHFATVTAGTTLTAADFSVI
jgi:Ca2+-binding RTX toxin-like protein